MEKYTDIGPVVQIKMNMEGCVPPVGQFLEPAGLTGFQQTGGYWNAHFTCSGKAERTRVFQGFQILDELDTVCPKCGGETTTYDHRAITLRDLPRGSMQTKIEIHRPRQKCTCCGAISPAALPFKAERHRITATLEFFIMDMLQCGMTHTRVRAETGVDRHAIKEIHMRMLTEKYVENGKLIRPAQQTDILGIDEFLLHGGHRYATIICDMRIGHILYIAHGKTKKVVEDFIEHVGMEWMRSVRAACCDMNAGFANAFQEACPDLKVVFDHFHIVKHFNEDVIDTVRKDEIARLLREGDAEGARSLKRAKYILKANRKTLEKRDAADQTALEKEKNKTAGDAIFRHPANRLRTDRTSQYDDLIGENRLLIAADLVKDMLADAYQCRHTAAMSDKINAIIRVCKDTHNTHFEKFAGLLERHLDGIVSHAEHPYSSGLMEGTVNKIKAVRRQAYGYNDDDFFFLLAMDATRRRTA